MKKCFLILFIIFSLLPVSTWSSPAKEKRILAPDTPDSEIIRMSPGDIDPSLLPLDSIEELHTTGQPMEVDIKKWRLEVSGPMVDDPLSLKYSELLKMDMIKKKVLLICPMFFADYAEWEGVPLTAILERAGIAESYKRITFYGLDGFNRTLSRDDVENNLLFLCLKVNGEILPEEHGYPVRLVAENIIGGRWVKWLEKIDIQ
jgi:sulfoxide reductase catalytic subunit YedY